MTAAPRTASVPRIASVPREALHAEWTKVRTTAGPAWLLLAVVVLTGAVSAAAAAAAVPCDRAGCGLDPAKVSLTGIQLGQAVVAVLAVLVVSGEYGTGMITVTLAAVPHRTTVVGAKATVVGGLVLVAGTVAVGVSVLAGRLLLPASAPRSLPLSLADGPTLRAAAGSVLYLVLIALLSLGIALVVRDAATAIGGVLGLLFLFPIIASVVANPSWHRHLQQIGPMTAGLAVQATVDHPDLPIGPWAGLGVLAAWAGGALLAGGLLLHRRDA